MRAPALRAFRPATRSEAGRPLYEVEVVMQAHRLGGLVRESGQPANTAIYRNFTEIPRNFTSQLDCGLHIASTQD